MKGRPLFGTGPSRFGAVDPQFLGAALRSGKMDPLDQLTPRELEDLAVRRLDVTADSAETLTSLFEEARYSEHALGEPDRDRAVRSLETIRADLED